MTRSNLAVVILAAGRSSRMGRTKTLLPWGDSTVIDHIIQQWRSLSAGQIAVAIDSSNEALRDLLVSIPEIFTITNPHPDFGMFSSIQSAARAHLWKTHITHFAIALGDQPQIKFSTLQTLANTPFTSVLQPAFQDKPLHPVLLTRAVFEQIANTQAPHLKAFLSEIPSRQTVEINDPGLKLDLDTPEDYQKALALSFPSPQK
jgi:molybdenum cofactor cytidylyltransferase